VTRVLVAYATREGQTQKIAEHVAATLRGRGVEADVIDVETAEPPPHVAQFDHVVLAGSLHLGKHEAELTRFAKTNAEALARVGASFLSVSMSEAGAEDPARTVEQRAKAVANVKEAIARFLADTGLRPENVMPVAGALKYREYGWLIRFVMKRISQAEGGPTDTSRDYEMTDWVALERFAEHIAASLHPA
jgi:menaquinone-dependent protoporphyrinogen oxidase